jgi:hypothetical protein
MTDADATYAFARRAFGGWQHSVGSGEARALTARTDKKPAPNRGRVGRKAISTDVTRGGTNQDRATRSGANTHNRHRYPTPSGGGRTDQRPAWHCFGLRFPARRHTNHSGSTSQLSATFSRSRIVPDLPCLLVMVCILAKGSGDCASPAYHDHPPRRLLLNFPDTIQLSAIAGVGVILIRQPRRFSEQSPKAAWGRAQPNLRAGSPQKETKHRGGRCPLF